MTEQKVPLLADLAEIEEIARKADAQDEPRWLVERLTGGRAEVRTWPSGVAIADVASEEQAAHIARWAPEEILACTAALRELVDATDDPRLLELLGRVIQVHRQ